MIYVYYLVFRHLKHIVTRGEHNEVWFFFNIPEYKLVQNPHIAGIKIVVKKSQKEPRAHLLWKCMLGHWVGLHSA